MIVEEDRRGCCRCSTGTDASARRGGNTRSGTVSRHADGWYRGKVLTLLIGANEDKLEGSTVAAEAACRDRELHSSESHPMGMECDVEELELDTRDAASENTEEVEEDADEEREEAYG